MSNPAERFLARCNEWAREFGLEPFNCGSLSQKDRDAGLAYMLEHVNFRDSMPERVIRELAPGDEIAILHAITGWKHGTVVSIRNEIDDDPFNASVLFRDRQGHSRICLCEYIGQVYRTATGKYMAASP